MKITIVQGPFLPVPALAGGAIEKAWLALGREFVRQGHEVTHISRCFPGLPREEIIDGVRHRRTPGFTMPRSMILLKAMDLIYSLNVWRLLEEADIVVTHTFWLPVLLRNRSKGAVYVHVGRYPKGQMKLYRRAAALQTVSSPIARAIAEQDPEAVGRVRVIPYPLTKIPDGPWRGQRERVILYVGRIHPEKGLALLLKAFAKLNPARGGEWKLVLVGPWEVGKGGGGEKFRDELDRLAEPVRGQVEWVGPEFDVERLDTQYRRAALFVYPSLAEKGETFGLAPLEAMAQGCPVLVSGLECFADFIRNGENGAVFRHRVPVPEKELAGKLEWLLGDEAERRRLGEAGYQTAKEYALTGLAARYLEDFRAILKGEKS